MDKVKLQREWLKSNFSDDDDVKSDQELRIPQPPLQKPYNSDAEIISLPDINKGMVKKNDVFDALMDRESIRIYSDENLTLEELSFLLWATQGVKRIKGDNYATRRPVPSAGGRHPFETYISVNRVEGLRVGIYRYLALTHELLFIQEDKRIDRSLVEVTLGQQFVGKSAVTFIWSVIPYRAEWRYSTEAHKPILLDAGHVCQNLYFACEAIGCGTCAIAAYDQEKIDNYLKLDGEDEFVVYLAPVGKRK